MGVSTTGWKTCKGCFFQQMLTVVIYQGQIARQNVHKFIFTFVPVPQGRYGPWIKGYVIHSKLGEINYLAQAGFMFSKLLLIF